jgi:hypothetical protein
MAIRKTSNGKKYPSRRAKPSDRVRLYLGAQSRFDPNEVYESQDKPGHRNEESSISVRKGGYPHLRKQNQKDMAAGESTTGKHGINQKNTMWVKPVRDPKTGKVIRKGYLAYRNEYEGGRIKDKKYSNFGNPTGSRRIRRGDPVTGRVKIASRGTTYLDEKRVVNRGGVDAETLGAGPLQIARYVGGKNVNSPTMRRRLSLGVADRTEQAKIAARKKKKK